jgi:hypothetical protein
MTRCRLLSCSAGMSVVVLALLPRAVLGSEHDEAPSASPVALLQVWGTAFDQDTSEQADSAGYGDPEDDLGFKIRRARLGLVGWLGHGVGYELVFGAASAYDVFDPTPTSVGLVDAFVKYKNGGLRLSAGQQKVPYSREALISIADIDFSDRSVAVEHIAPGREVGFLAGWKKGGFQVRGGAFNGNANFQGDDNFGLLWAGRVEFGDADQRDYETFGHVTKPVFGVAANAFYNDDLGVNTLMYGIDAIFRVEGFCVLVEGDTGTLSPDALDSVDPAVLQDTIRHGASGQVGYSIWRLEPALRASWFDDDADVEDNGDVLEIQGGLSWHLPDDHFKVGGGYIHRTELQGRAVPNDTVRLWAQARY